MGSPGGTRPRGRAVNGGIGERADDLQLLDDRAGPAVRDDERQRILVPGTDVDEMYVEPVDLGDEVRQGVQPPRSVRDKRTREPQRDRARARPESRRVCAVPTRGTVS